MLATGVACQFSKVGLCLSSLPSTKLGVKWVGKSKYPIFLFKIRILLPKWPLSGLTKHNLLLERIFNEKYSVLIDYFVRNRRFALIIKNGSLLPEKSAPLGGSVVLRRKNITIGQESTVILVPGPGRSRSWTFYQILVQAKMLFQQDFDNKIKCLPQFIKIYSSWWESISRTPLTS